jgi:hypothetical protein
LIFVEKSESTRSGGCFDGESIVYTREGVLPISDVKIGDEILALSSDGSLQFSEVLLFLDRDRLSPRLYYEIETESGSKISLTPSHLLFVSDDNSTELSKQLSRVEFAKNVQKGQFLYTSSLGDINNNNKSMTIMKDLSKKQFAYLDRIVSISTKIGTGAYAPLTREGNLIVNNVIASCYAVINDQSIAHWSFLPIRLLHNIKDSFQSIAYLLHLTKRQSNTNTNTITNTNTSLVSSHQNGIQNDIQNDIQNGIQNGVHWYPRMLYSLSKYLIPSDKMY